MNNEIESRWNDYIKVPEARIMFRLKSAREEKLGEERRRRARRVGFGENSRGTCRALVAASSVGVLFALLQLQKKA